MGSSSSNRGRRRSRRSRRHEAHHAAESAGPEKPLKVPDHPLIPGGDPERIEDAAALADLVAHVREAGSFAYDTEFIGEETYDPVICLIQIATGDRIALVDPLADLDVTPVWELVADPEVETLVHAGQQDLEPIVRFLGRPPARVIDTQIAGAFLNRPYPLGLRRLVEEFVGVHLRKALTFTRWDKRPLSTMHARYAADDVRYLPAVWAAVSALVEERGYGAFVREECAALSDLDRYRFDADARLAKMVGNRLIRPRGVAILRALIELRDRLAREADVPPRTFLKDDVLVRLARDPVKDVNALEAIKNMPRPVARTHGDLFLGAIADARALPAEDLPAPIVREEEPVETMRVEAMWSLAGAYCRGRGIDPGFVTSRREIARFYFALVDGAPDPTRLAEGWRARLLGDLLRDVVAGRRSVCLRWSGEDLSATLDEPAASPGCPG